MAYVSGYLHDIFVSYATANDKVDGLVRHFYTLLAGAIDEAGLRVRDEHHPDGVDIFLDRRSIETGSDLAEQIDTNARSAAVFIMLHSSAYLKSDWCQQEAKAFLSNYDPRRPKLTGRFFVASFGTRGNPAQSPLELVRGRRYRKFYYVNGDGEDFPFDPGQPQQRNPDELTLKEEARELAREIVETLEAMKNEPPPPRVFLAETSPARQAQAEDIRNWLLQRQVVVLRASGTAPDWETDSRAFIGQASLFVDLSEPAPTPAGVRQAQLATELGKKRVRWLPRGELAPEAAQVVMQETSLVEETLEDFKTSLLPLIIQTNPGPGVAGGAGGVGGAPAGPRPMVVLVSSKLDEAYLAELERQIEALGGGSDALITDEVIAKPDDWHMEMGQRIEMWNAVNVVFVDGQCAGSWRDTRLRHMIGIAHEAMPTRIPGLCRFPPPNKPDRRVNPTPDRLICFDPGQLDQLKLLLGLT